MTEQTRDILITGASLLGGEPTDIALSGGTIVAIGADARNNVRDPRVIVAEGLIALPGLVDIHTHLRQPGGEDAETVFTGTRAAAVGGYTAVHAMANTTPTQDTAAIVDQVLRLGEEADWVEVRPVPRAWKASISHRSARWPVRARRSVSSPTTASACPIPSSCAAPSNMSRVSAV